MKYKELIGKMVFVPRHDYTREKFAYLASVEEDGRVTLLDFEGNREVTFETSVELREATKEEVVVEFLREIGFYRDLSELGNKKDELVDGMFAKLLEDGKNRAGQWIRC